MFLRVRTRRKDGKLHRYWSVVENRRARGGRVVQRQVLHLGELNDAPRAGWVRSIEALTGDQGRARQLALFPDDRRQLPALECEAVRVRVGELQLRRPRQFGACWLALELWRRLGLDEFFEARLAPSRKRTRWTNVLKALTVYRLVDPGSEFRLHREWYERSALGDLLGEDFALAAKDKLYRCLDLLAPHREALFAHLWRRWGELFEAHYDVLPVAYEVYPGNTHEATTLEDFLDLVERRWGRARRTWLMDRGIPTERTLERMRARGIDDLVGTPKGRLTKLEKPLLERPWVEARESVRVKLLEQDEELYVYVQSQQRVRKERAMRRRRLKRLWARLGELRARQGLSRDRLLLSLGAAKKEAGRVWRLVRIRLPAAGEAADETTFSYELDREKLRQAMRREGRYLLRSNMRSAAPDLVWENYLLLTRIEQAFKELKGDLAVRPIYHQLDARIEAHIFVSFLAYCLHATLRNLARRHAAGLTARAILEKLSAIAMIDVHLPSTDGREILLRRYTEPEPDQALLLAELGLELPSQPRPQILAATSDPV